MKIFNKKLDKELDFKIVVTAYNYDIKDYVVLVFNDFEDFDFFYYDSTLTFVSKIIEVTNKGSLINCYLFSNNITSQQDFIDYCMTL